jgi:hypothetical protein
MTSDSRIKRKVLLEYILGSRKQRPEQMEIYEIFQDNVKGILIMFRAGKLILKD